MYDGLTPLELGVTCDIFGDGAWRPPGEPWYRFTICAATPGLVTMNGGLQLHVTHGLETLRRADTVIVPPHRAAG